MSCACAEHRGFVPTERPLNEGHVAPRFPGYPMGRCQCVVNGVDVTDKGVEACPGSDGFVVVYHVDPSIEDGKRHICPQCRAEHPGEKWGVCVERVEGDVEMRIWSAA